MEISVYLVPSKPQTPAPCIPVFVLGEGRTSPPALDHDQAIALVQIILTGFAKRSVPRGRHSKESIRSDFVCYFGTCLWRRGSDLVERTYAAVEILKRCGLTEKAACLEVAAMLGSRIGQSKRGKRRRKRKDGLHPAENVRSLYNDFKHRHPWRAKLPDHDLVVEKWYSTALSISTWAQEMVSAGEMVAKKDPILEKLLLLAQQFAPWAKNLLSLRRFVPARPPRLDVAEIPRGWQPSGILTFRDLCCDSSQLEDASQYSGEHGTAKRD